jgi:DNA polymerase-3 subunit gamma/tau
MFENIIGQTEVVRALREEIPQGRFPRAALFYGPAYAGKLSAALEAARVLTCTGGSAEWSCECPSCRMQKELSHPQTVLLGPRYADVEIAACADALMRSRKPATLYLFIRAVRKLTRRFDPLVVDADEARTKAAVEKAVRIEEVLAELAPGKELPPARELGDLLEKIVAAAAPVAAQARGDAISIAQVRRLAAWAHVTASGACKVAVIENADRMQDSARNALLKLLEEPPASVHLILLSTRRSAIIPTILSRLRPYTFLPRSPSEEKEVLSKIFRQDPPAFDSLRAFFLAWREINAEKLASLAGRFLELVGSDTVEDIVERMAEMQSDRKIARDRLSRETTASFLEELLSHMHKLMRGGLPGVDVLEQWSEAVREAHLRLETINMNPSTVLEALYFRMRAALHREEASASVMRGDGSAKAAI